LPHTIQEPDESAPLFVTNMSSEAVKKSAAAEKAQA
jgi:hypothetical protein